MKIETYTCAVDAPPLVKYDAFNLTLLVHKIAKCHVIRVDLYHECLNGQANSLGKQGLLHFLRYWLRLVAVNNFITNSDTLNRQ